MARLRDLFIAFFKIGATTIGGGYAMLPLIEREVVERRQWVSRDEMLTCLAVGQITPGVMAVNTATFVGYRQRGVLGGIVATLGMVSPSLVTISIIAAFLSNFAHFTLVQYAFRGIRVAVAALILDAVWRLGRNTRGLVPLLVCAASLLASVVFSASPVWIVLGATITGFLLFPGKKIKADSSTPPPEPPAGGAP